MKIIHIIIGLGIGGAELMLKRLVEGLDGKDRMQHSVISLTNLGPVGQQLQDAGISVTALGMKNALSLPSTFFKLRRELKKQAPDIVQTWMYHADFLGGLASKSLGIKRIIWSVRNTFIESRGKINFLFRKLCSYLSYRIPSQVIYVSNSARKEHISSGFNPHKSVVIGNGFDTSKYSFNEKNRDIYRHELMLTDNNIAVFSVGRYVPAKDHLTFVKAICNAAKSNKNVRGILIGRNISLEKFNLSNDEASLFIVLGERKDVAELLSAADIFCLHSITEGFPNVLGEAMSVGLPCIVTRAGDAEIILNDIESTFAIQDYFGISEKIVFFAENEEIRKNQGLENRKSVINNYALESILDTYSLLYKDKSI